MKMEGVTRSAPGAGGRVARRARSRLTVAFGLVLLLGTAFAGRAEEELDPAQMRTWTSSSGTTIEARVDGVERGRLVLVTEDGRRLGIALSDLCAEDAALGARLVEEFAEDDEEAVAVETGPEKLPVFSSGTWQGLNAVYQHNHMDVTVDVEGRVRIYPKDGGQRVGRPMTLTTHYYYTTRHGRSTRTRGRRVAAYENPPAPAMQPARLAYKGTLADGVAFEEHVEFAGASVTVSTRVVDPEGLEQHTVQRLNLSLPPTHTIAPDVPQEERIKLLEGHKLDASPRRGRGPSFTFYDPIRSFGGPAQISLSGPTWGQREIIISAHSRELNLSPYIYQGRSLWQGFLIRLHKNRPDARYSDDGMRIEIK